MTKKIKKTAAVVMGAFIGAYIGLGIYDYVYLIKKHPEVYAVQSAPWYTGLLVRLLILIPVILICLAAILLAGRKEKEAGE